MPSRTARFSRVWQAACKLVIFVRVRTLFALPLSAAAAFFLLQSTAPGVLAGQNLQAETARGNSEVLWRDPGNIASLDFAGGPQRRYGAPKPPFNFQEEVGGGTSPKILVRDADKRLWEVKWGEEGKPETFVSRLLWALGYLAEPTYFVPSGTIENVGALSRAASQIERPAGNAFANARFELRPDNALFVPGKGWLFNDNPFVGTNELKGLLIVSMLVSNWDLKDPSSSDGSNTAIFRVRDGDTEELHYMINDWGATMGKWGGISSRSKWDCRGYASQNKDFVKGVRGGQVRFGYGGKRPDLAKGITVENVRWLMQYLGQITDAQLRAGLGASGASPGEMECFVPAIRERIERLRSIGGESAHTD
jgi:hypothetical protein